jgi:DNA (cytosine-5)-methyltransferase 1
VTAHLAKYSLNSVDPVLPIGRKYRRFTPREVARIQSFPDSFKLVNSENRQYRALGNAVPPVLMWHISKKIVSQLVEMKKTQRELIAPSTV